MIRPHVMVPVSESNGFFTHFLPLAATLQASTWKKVSRTPENSPGGQPDRAPGPLVVAEVLPEELLLVGPEAAAGRGGALRRFALLLALE
jgi:hypothetical protein